MRREDAGCAVGNLVDLLDEDGTLGAQVIDDEAIVYDLVPHVDRRAQRLERALDDLDGPVDAGAEAPWIGQQDLHQDVSAFSARRVRHQSSSMSRISRPVPTEIAMSATLKAAKCQLPT